MIDILTIIEFFKNYPDDIALVVCLLSLSGATLLSLSAHKTMLKKYIAHKRNRWYFVFLLLFVAIYIIIIKRMNPPIAWMICALTLLLLYSFACFISLRPIKKTRNPILRKYRKHLENGLAFEYISYFQKDNHWYLIDTDVRIEYQMLRSYYFLETMDYAAGYQSLLRIKEQDLYPIELEEVILRKAILLSLMGKTSTTFILLGNPQQSASQNPVVWIKYAYVYEHEGKIDEAFQCAQRAVDLSIQTNPKDTEKAAIYNDYARYLLFLGNNNEAIRYFQMAFDIAKGYPDIRSIQIMASNLVIQLARAGAERADCEQILHEYKNCTKHSSVHNITEISNCEIWVYRQFGDEKKVFELIKQGYKDIKYRLDHTQLALCKASTFKMLMHGSFVHEWFDFEVEAEYAVYSNLPLPERLQVFMDYMSIFQQNNFRHLREREPYATLYNTIMTYYLGDAIQEIDAFRKTINVHEVIKHKAFTMYRLGIMKLVQGKKHIEMSKQLYTELADTLFSAGLRIDATDVLITLMEECTSPYNVKIHTPYLTEPVHYVDLLATAPPPPEPIRHEDGFHLIYQSQTLNVPFVVEAAHQDVIEYHIDRAIAEIDSWKSHPAKTEMAIRVARLLCCVDRRDDAKIFYEHFLSQNISPRQYAPWFQVILNDLAREFEM